MSIWSTSPQAVSFQRALLLALTSAKTVSKLCGLLVHPSCMLLCGYPLRPLSGQTPPLFTRSVTIECFLSSIPCKGRGYNLLCSILALELMEWLVRPCPGSTWQARGELPTVDHSHSTCNMAMWMALFNSIRVEVICFDGILPLFM